MLKSNQSNNVLQITSGRWLLPACLLILPLLLLHQLGFALIAGQLDLGDLIGLTIGVFLPLIAACYLFESTRFKFSKHEGLFNWQRLGFFGRVKGEVPLYAVVKIKLEELEANDLIGMQTACRLIVVLDDDEEVALSRNYSKFQDKPLNALVKQIRDFLGQHTPMD